VCQAAFRFFEDVVENFYSDATWEERTARCALLECLRNPYHIIRDHLAVSHQGNKSGNAFTDVFNSITNTAIHYYTWIVSTGMSLAEFDQKVRMLTYGDDVVQSVSPGVLDRYNGVRIQRILKHWGYEVTPAEKNAEMEEWIPLHKVTFLKGGFVPRHGVWWAPMPMRDILKELKYRPKDLEGDDTDLRLRFKQVQRFIAHIGEEELLRFQARHRCVVPRAWVSDSYSTIVEEMREKQSTYVHNDY